MRKQTEEPDFPRDLMVSVLRLKMPLHSACGIIHAGFYALLLRADGYPPEEAAALVIERYPCARLRLQKVLRLMSTGETRGMQGRTGE